MHGSLSDVTDTLSSRGAMVLAAQIQNFWKNLGLEVKAWVEPIRAEDEDGTKLILFQVRSNILEALAACLS